MNNKTKKLDKVILNFRHKIWGVRQCLCIALYKSNIFHDYFYKKSVSYNKAFIRKWRTPNGHFNFNGALLPDVTSIPEMTFTLKECFMDTFLISCCYEDNYDKEIVEYVDRRTREGAYGYIDHDLGFDVTVKAGDIVIDAGAWIGDFAAYAASKGAISYAFEPTPMLLPYLKKASELNSYKIIPVSKGLGKENAAMNFSNDGVASFGNKLIQNVTDSTMTVSITTLDSFVEENSLERIDFIKADIEGAERDMLQGAKETLRKFAPKLTICTYHLPDDPLVLETLIKEANPNYTVIQKRHKLHACVIPSNKKQQ